jgi:hypothetical protein
LFACGKYVLEIWRRQDLEKADLEKAETLKS